MIEWVFNILRGSVKGETPHKLRETAQSFEKSVFEQCNSKETYTKMISDKLKIFSEKLQKSMTSPAVSAVSSSSVASSGKTFFGNGSSISGGPSSNSNPNNNTFLINTSVGPVATGGNSGSMILSEEEKMHIKKAIDLSKPILEKAAGLIEVLLPLEFKDKETLIKFIQWVRETY